MSFWSIPVVRIAARERPLLSFLPSEESSIPDYPSVGNKAQEGSRNENGSKHAHCHSYKEGQREPHYQSSTEVVPKPVENGTSDKG